MVFSHIDRIMYFCHVTKMSRCINITKQEKRNCCESATMSKMSLCCKYVLSSTLSRNASCKYVTQKHIPKREYEGKNDPLRWKMTPLQWKMTPLQWKMTPPVENEVDPTDGKCHSDSIV